MEIDNELLESGVAKERVAMFKNLQSGTQSTGAGADSKIRVDVSSVSFYFCQEIVLLQRTIRTKLSCSFFFHPNQRIFDGTLTCANLSMVRF